MESCSQSFVTRPVYLQGLDIDHLLYVAHKRFVEGIQTMELLQQALSEKEKEEIALVALLEVNENLSLELKCHEQPGGSWSLDDVRRAMLRRGLDGRRSHAM